MTAAFNFPTVTVELSFTAANASQSFSSTYDISRFVRSMRIHRGRQHELQRVEAGTADIVLTNQDGRFSPWNTGSPYYSVGQGMVPGVGVQVAATWNGTTYKVFTGRIQSWTPGYGQTRSDMTLQVVDDMKLLSLAYLDNSYYPTQVIADGATGLWRMSDAVGALTAADTSGSNHNGGLSPVAGTITFGGRQPIPTDLGTSVTLASVSGSYPYIDPGSNASLTGTSYSIEAWVNLGTTNPPASSPVYPLLQTDSSVSTSAYQFLFELAPSTGQPEVLFAHSGSSIGSVTGSTGLADGNWHHLVATRSGTAVHFYVDGASAGSVTLSSNPSSTANDLQLGGTSTQIPTTGYSYSLANVAVYQGVVLSAAQALNHYQLGVGGFVVDYSGNRINDVLQALMPTWAGATNLATGISQVQAASSPLTSTTALAYIQTVENSEQGVLDVDPAGTLRFRDRHYIYTNAAATTSNFTVDVSTNAAHGHPVPGSMVPAADDLDLWNSVAAQRVNGATQHATDSTSQNTYGQRNLTGFTGLLNTSDNEALALAQSFVGRYKTPVTRVRSVTLDSVQDGGANLPQMLNRDLLDRITVTWTPFDNATAHPYSSDALIESIQHEVDAKTAIWKTTWGLSTTEAVANLPLIYDHSGAQGEYDQSYSYIF